jgi:MFS family permease
MNTLTKQDIDKPIGGLFFMIINTSIWAFIAEYYLENKDQLLIGILLGLIISSFLYFYLKFTKAQKSLPESNVEKTDQEKKNEKRFLIVFGLEGIGILITKNILMNINHDELFISFFVLIVGLHFFPLGKIFKRTFDLYIGTWTCLFAILGIYLITQKITTSNFANVIVSLGCAFATISYGIRMILEGRKLLLNEVKQN